MTVKRITSHDRYIDPGSRPRQAVQERIAPSNQRDTAQAVKRNQRYDDSTTRIVTADSIYWYRANIGASGDAAYGMRLGTPSSDSAWAMTNLQLPAASQGRIVRLYLWSTEARTAGAATARVRIIDGGVTTDYTFPDCQLNGTTTQLVSRRYLWENAVTFSASATLEGRIVTTGTFGPTTADMTLVMAIGYDEMI